MDSRFADWRKLQSGSDIRGSEERLTDEFVQNIGYAFAQWTARKCGTTSDQIKIAVGHDPRPSSPRIKDALINGMKAADSDVLDCGLCTTPAMFLTCMDNETRANGAIMITASSQPAGWNGMKFMTRQGSLTDTDVDELIRLASVSVLRDPLVRKVDIMRNYIETLKETVHRELQDDSLKPLLGLHVVVDAGSGCGGFYVDFLNDLGATTAGSRLLKPGENFPDTISNPENDESLEYISGAVPANKADLGILFDVDGDRVAIVDQNGKAINRNRLIALIAAIMLDAKSGLTFVTDSVTSSGLQQFINEWGGTHYRYRRGYRNVIDEAMRLNEEGIDCPLAIETSGHAAFRENYFLDDGVYLVTRLICEAMRRKWNGLTLSSLIDELKEPVESAALRLTVLDEDIKGAAQEVIERILSHTLENPEWVMAPDNREGVRILFSLEGGVHNAWFQLRISRHDPVLVLNAESDVPGGITRILGQLYKLTKDIESLDWTPLRQFVQNT